MRPVAVGIVGYGTIGKRVADAVARQPDMRVAGIGLRTARAGALVATWRGYPLFCTDGTRDDEFAAAGLTLAGDLAALIARSDVVVDCAPAGLAARRLPLYRDAGKPAVFHGGEAHDAIGLTFASFVNYAAALSAPAARVASCNTTGLVRLLALLDGRWGVAAVRAVLVRCAADPGKDRKGIVDGAVPGPGLSHHGADVRRLLPKIDIETQAVTVPMTRGHLACLFVELGAPARRNAVLGLLAGAPRIVVADDGPSTCALGAEAAAAGRPRGDRPELLVWRDSLVAARRAVSLQALIHMESIVIPETVDCIRAVAGRERDAAASMLRTDRAMGIAKESRAYGRFRS